MSTPRVSCIDRYTVRDGDFVLLAFKGEHGPCFDRSLLPARFPSVSPPAEKGKAWVGFAGQIGSKRITVRAARLDAEHCGSEAQMKKAVAATLKEAVEYGARGVVIPVADGDLVSAAQEGVLLGGYRFDKYLAKHRPPLTARLVTGPLPAVLRRRLSDDRTVCQAVNFARDMANEPPNACRPRWLADALKKEGMAAGLDVAVWNEARLRRERCGGIIEVGRGSRDKPRLLIGRYAPKGKARAHLCLVGKGVTFDTGGYCLKPAEGQMGMKYDMCGASSMWAAACAIARLKLPIRLTVLAPLVENRISEDAYLTTGLIRMRNGTTVEVINTDAEGRLILADALVLGAENKPDCMIDAATLTGSCVAALGEDIAGAFGTDRAFTDKLVSAGNAVGERFWELPLHMPYMEQLETTIADCKNGAGRWGGPIIGALFLSKFVPDSIPWIHLDIAGPGTKEDPLDHLGKGAKGFGVKAVVALAGRLGEP